MIQEIKEMLVRISAIESHMHFRKTEAVRTVLIIRRSFTARATQLSSLQSVCVATYSQNYLDCSLSICGGCSCRKHEIEPSVPCESAAFEADTMHYAQTLRPSHRL